MTETNLDIFLMDEKNAVKTSRSEEYLLEEIGKYERSISNLYKTIRQYEDELETEMSEDDRDGLEARLEDAQLAVEAQTEMIQKLNWQLENPNFEEHE